MSAISNFVLKYIDIQIMHFFFLKKKKLESDCDFEPYALCAKLSCVSL